MPKHAIAGPATHARKQTRFGFLRCLHQRADNGDSVKYRFRPPSRRNV